jgi:hypothetical protein
MTHTWRCCRNHKSLHVNLPCPPGPLAYTCSPDAKLTDLYRLLQKEMQNDLHWPVLSKQKTNNRLQFTMTYNFIKSALWKTCFHGGELTGSCEM